MQKAYSLDPSWVDWHHVWVGLLQACVLPAVTVIVFWLIIKLLTAYQTRRLRRNIKHEPQPYGHSVADSPTHRDETYNGLRALGGRRNSTAPIVTIRPSLHIVRTAGDEGTADIDREAG